MADNVTLNSMSGGSVVATDDSGTGHVQVVKLAYSQDGSRTHIEADAAGLLVRQGAIVEANVTSYMLISASGTNDASVAMASAFIRVHGYHVSNTSETAWAFLKLYDLSSAPIVGTDTPFMTIGVPPGSVSEASFPFGVKMNNGLGIGITQLADQLDTTGVGSNEVAVNIVYENV